MGEKLKTELTGALTQPFARDLIVFLYREHAQGASFAALKEMLFAHEDIAECQLEGLVKQEILEYDGVRYRLAEMVRNLLDHNPGRLMSEPSS